MIKSIIIDDENKAVTALEVALMDYCPEVSVVGKANSADEGIKEIQQKHPDLVFLDIEMPGMSGLEMIEHLTIRNFEVIFVTAYNQYAVRAFRVAAVDYLLKNSGIFYQENLHYLHQREQNMLIYLTLSGSRPMEVIPK